MGRPEIAGSADAAGQSIPARAVIRLNTPVLPVCVGVGVSDGRWCWRLVPALKAARKDINDVRCGIAGRESAAGSVTGSCANAVVVLEVMLSLMLLVTAGLLMRSFGSND